MIMNENAESVVRYQFRNFGALIMHYYINAIYFTHMVTLRAH